MLAAASRLWWVLVLQGVLGITFGILAIIFPGLALVTLAYIFAIWAIVSGLSHLGEGMRVAEARGRSWPFAVIGVISLLAGVLALIVPGITVFGLVLLLGAWLVTQGAMEVYTAYRIRREVTGEWILALVGVVRTLIGLVILALPIVGALLTATLLAVYAIVAGVTALTLGWRLRGLRSGPTGSTGRTVSAGT
ncbi:MAG: HdeD family acid-resistance protein [Deltaproteobacteria bacterium]|nr:MAG: HdeD family acid-resistance protein [Deltaproteobacteria bacterium]